MNLYNRFKVELGEQKAVISDKEFLILNRKNYLTSQISSVHGFLSFFEESKTFGIATRSYFQTIDIPIAAIRNYKRGVDLFTTTPHQTIAMFWVFLRLGHIEDIKIYAPRGIQKLSTKSEFLNEIFDDFSKLVIKAIPGRVKVRKDRIYIGFCNCLKEGEIPTVVELSENYDKKLIFFKDYGLVNAIDYREFLDEKKLFPIVGLDGNGIHLDL